MNISKIRKTFFSILFIFILCSTQAFTQDNQELIYSSGVQSAQGFNYSESHELYETSLDGMTFYVVVFNSFTETASIFIDEIFVSKENAIAFLFYYDSTYGWFTEGWIPTFEEISDQMDEMVSKGDYTREYCIIDNKPSVIYTATSFADLE